MNPQPEVKYNQDSLLYCSNTESVGCSDFFISVNPCQEAALSDDVVNQ